MDSPPPLFGFKSIRMAWLLVPLAMLLLEGCLERLDFFGAFCLNVGILTAFYAEMEALITAIEIAWAHGWHHLWFEMDSLSVLQCLTNHPPWPLFTRWKNCKMDLSNMHFYASHIFREGNAVADKFSKMGLSQPSLKWWSTPPFELLPFLSHETSGPTTDLDKCFGMHVLWWPYLWLFANSQFLLLICIKNCYPWMIDLNANKEKGILMQVLLCFWFFWPWMFKFKDPCSPIHFLLLQSKMLLP